MIVEFIGLPASGKTTIAKGIYYNFKQESYNIRYPLLEVYKLSWLKRNLYKSVKVLSYSIKNFNKTFLFSKLIFSYRQVRLGDYFRILFNNIYFFSIQEQYSCSKDIIIFDEGSIHHIWAITLGAVNEVNLQEIIKYYKVADLTIYVKVDEKILKQRNKKRITKDEDIQKNKLNYRHRYIISNIEKESKNINKILFEIKKDRTSKNKKIMITTNDSTDDLEKNINFICEEIKN